MNHFDMMRSCVYGPGCLMMKYRIRNAESEIRNSDRNLERLENYYFQYEEE